MENYDQSVEINQIQVGLIFLTTLIESQLLVIRDKGKLMCYWALKTSTTRYWRNLCIRQRLFWIKLSIDY